MRKSKKKVNVYDVSRHCRDHEHTIKSLKNALRTEQKTLNNYVLLNVELENRIMYLEKVVEAANNHLIGSEDDIFAQTQAQGGIKELRSILKDALTNYAHYMFNNVT